MSAKFIGTSDRQDKYVISPICLISSRTEMSDVASNTIYTQSRTDISSVLWNDSSNRTECPMKFHKVSRTLNLVPMYQEDFHLLHYRQFPPKLPPQHTENRQSLHFPPIRKVNLRGWPLNQESKTLRSISQWPRASFADVIWYIAEQEGFSTFWVQRSFTQVNFEDWRKS